MRKSSVPSSCLSTQEARILRWIARAAPHAAVVDVCDLFAHGNHVCMVMPWHPRSLLDVIVHSSSWKPEVLVKQVRSLGALLLVRLPA